MGAKHDLAPRVAAVISELQPGACLDAFAGMCSVAGALAASGRSTWCNDVQAYASVVAKAVVATPAPPPTRHTLEERLAEAFTRNRGALHERFGASIEAEQRVLRRGYRRQYEELARCWRHVGNDQEYAREAEQLRVQPSFPNRLNTLTFAHGYFGVAQAIDIDSLRFAIVDASANASLTDAEANWALVALIQTASRIASTTGHFAEYLHPHSKSVFRRIRLLRQRDVMTQFLTELDRLAPFGSETWRQTNRVFTGSANDTISGLDEDVKVSVVYADPPYSRAQYSRYYHVLETLVLYDYPHVTGSGRYRTGRYQTPFSHAGSVVSAFEQLVDAVADKQASLVLSYPTNGLLYERDLSPAKLIRRRFKHVRLAAHRKLAHSTLGAAAGQATLDVREMIFVGQQPD